MHRGTSDGLPLNRNPITIVLYLYCTQNHNNKTQNLILNHQDCNRIVKTIGLQLGL